jgi:hypothetical protein
MYGIFMVTKIYFNSKHLLLKINILQHKILFMYIILIFLYEKNKNKCQSIYLLGISVSLDFPKC